MRQWIACNARPIIIRSNELVAFHQLHCRLQSEHVFQTPAIRASYSSPDWYDSWRSVKKLHQNNKSALYRSPIRRLVMTYNDAWASSDKRTSCVDIFDSVVLLPDQLHLPRIRSKRSATLIWYIVQIKHDSMKDTQKNQRAIETGVA